MHTDSFHIDLSLARKLLRQQAPKYADLNLEGFSSDGSDNVIFRLGQNMCVRMPLTPRASRALLKEVQCLPKLPNLPLDVPSPLVLGEPTEDYKSPWAIYNWIEGSAATGRTFKDERDAAKRLAQFVGALQQVDVADIPIYGPHNNQRGCPLAERHDLTVRAIEGVSDLFNEKRLSSVWGLSRDLSSWLGAPVVIHGDIHAANLLTRDDELTAVIDFGLMGVGDPAVDLIVNWSLFNDESRRCFREYLEVEEETWLRGRGWALSIALIALAYYRNTNRFISEMSTRVITEVLNDCEC